MRILGIRHFSRLSMSDRAAQKDSRKLHSRSVSGRRRPGQGADTVWQSRMRRAGRGALRAWRSSAALKLTGLCLTL